MRKHICTPGAVEANTEGTPYLRCAVDGCDALFVQAGCEWFAMCENAATTFRDHPVLGQVPICSRCDALCARLS